MNRQSRGRDERRIVSSQTELAFQRGRYDRPKQLNQGCELCAGARVELHCTVHHLAILPQLPGVLVADTEPLDELSERRAPHHLCRWPTAIRTLGNGGPQGPV